MDRAAVTAQVRLHGASTCTTSTCSGRARTWHLGDIIHVVAERIDPIRRRVEFALADSKT